MSWATQVNSAKAVWCDHFEKRKHREDQGNASNISI